MRSAKVVDQPLWFGSGVDDGARSTHRASSLFEQRVTQTASYVIANARLVCSDQQQPDWKLFVQAIASSKRSLFSDSDTWR
ncbi:hypothetical protein ALC53_08072 [Atta colombica]|uniref:Uncharacterized protein n=1 Tax=Atta colombica TaxID=520822 RepID=A0A151I2N5_9HYME|nr:hypothetical protein ALC53_08072 [Atta colombica]